MLRRCLSAVVVLFVLGGFVAAEVFRGQVTEVKKDGDKLASFTVTYKKKGETEAMKKTIKVNADTKYFKAKGKGKPEPGDADDVKKGARVFGEEKDGTASKVVILAGRGKGKGKGKDKDKD
jgi:hypothetical protein